MGIFSFPLGISSQSSFLQCLLPALLEARSVPPSFCSLIVLHLMAMSMPGKVTRDLHSTPIPIHKYNTVIHFVVFLFFCFVFCLLFLSHCYQFFLFLVVFRMSWWAVRWVSCMFLVFSWCIRIPFCVYLTHPLSHVFILFVVHRLLVPSVFLFLPHVFFVFLIIYWCFRVFLASLFCVWGFFLFFVQLFVFVFCYLKVLYGCFPPPLLLFPSYFIFIFFWMGLYLELS